MSPLPPPALPISSAGAELDVKQPPTATTAAATAPSASAEDPDEGWLDLRPATRRRLEFLLICFCNVAWTIDAEILPTFFHEFQMTFGVSQTALNGLSSAKGITAALFGFPCGFAQELLPRPLLIGVGMLFWAAGLLACSLAPSFEVVFLGRIVNGMGLGIVQPLLLSLLVDKTRPTQRGLAFGTIFFVGSVCKTLFVQLATQYTAVFIAGVIGWRMSLLCVTVFSAVVGLVTMLYVTEPNREKLASRDRKKSFVSVFSENMPKVVQLFKYPTFILILCQGAPGTAPWSVFPNFTQWLQLSCFDNTQTGLIFSAFGWGCALSNLLSGLLLNFTARRFPDHGPPTLANISVAIGIPFLALFFFILPTPAAIGEGADLVPAYYVSFLFFGIGAAMCGTINKKVFSDIVPSSVYTYVFAIDQVIEQSIGNILPLLLGVVTDRLFGFDVDAATRGECAPEEAQKLGNGMFIVCNVAWAICFLVYLGMHWTYPKDRRRQLELRRAALQPSSGEEAAEKDDAEAETSPLSSEQL